MADMRSLPSTSRAKTRGKTPQIVVQLFSILQKTDVNATAYRMLALAQYCLDLENVLFTLMQQLVNSPSTYGPHLELMCYKLNRTSELLLVRFVKQYNALAVTSKRCDDIGWNPASILFAVLCKTRYMAELCHTASLVLYGRRQSAHVNETSWTQFDAEDSNAALTEDEREENVHAADTSHAHAKPAKRRRYGAQLPLPFFPLRRDEAKRAFRVYTEVRNKRVQDDYRPKKLYWKPSHETGCEYIVRGVYMFGPDLRIGEYTQWQVLMQLQRLAQVWHFLDPDYPTLYTLLSALLLRAAEILSRTFVHSDHVLDAPKAYREHAVWQGQTEPAESRNTTKKMVARPDGTIGYEDSDEIKILKREIDEHGSTVKQASARFAREVAGLFRNMYRELLFYKECVAPRKRRSEMCRVRVQSSLFRMLRNMTDTRTAMLDRDTESQEMQRLRLRKIRKRNKRRKQRIALERQRAGQSIACGSADETAQLTPMEVVEQAVSEAEMPDPDGSESADANASAFDRASIQQLDVMVRVIKSILMRHAADIRDSTFIDSVVRRVGVDTVPHGYRELYASMNEGIMGSSAEAQEQTCFPYQILSHRRNMWPAVGLDYFLSPHFSPRTHSRVVCAVFQKILYTMDDAFLWNDKETSSSLKQAHFKPCVVYDTSADFEANKTDTRDAVPRIYVIMSAFYIVLDNHFYRVPGDNIFEAIVYWLLLFADQKFTRSVNASMAHEWVALRHWLADIVKRNTETLLLAQFDTT